MKSDFTGFRLLRCPECHAPSLSLDDSHHIACVSCGAPFFTLKGVPVLVRRDNALFPHDAYLETTVGAPREKRFGSRFFPSPSVNLSRARCLRRFMSELRDREGTNVLVVGSGLQRASLESAWGRGRRAHITYVDVDAHADVDFYCDAHDLPFRDQTFDGVITTAVLEHVLYPERVVAEISRTLKTSGVIYSELPFMQQVHEGAYDFTRYTYNGHCRLLNSFQKIEAGMVAGPSTALVWAIEHFVIAFPSKPWMRHVLKSLARLSFWWLKYLDYFLVARPQAMDGASCTYFLGRKSTHATSDLEIVLGYVGAKRVRHI